MMRSLLILVLPIILSACATTYQPQGLSGGFSETQLDTNVFKVSFRGNGYTHAERAEDLALLRSAELTLKNGLPISQLLIANHAKSMALTLPPRSRTQLQTLLLMAIQLTAQPRLRPMAAKLSIFQNQAQLTQSCASKKNQISKGWSMTHSFSATL